MTELPEHRACRERTAQEHVDILLITAERNQLNITPNKSAKVLYDRLAVGEN